MTPSQDPLLPPCHVWLQVWRYITLKVFEYVPPWFSNLLFVVPAICQMATLMVTVRIFMLLTLFDPSFCVCFSLCCCLHWSTDYFVLFDTRILDHLLHSKDKLTSRSRKLLHKLKLPHGPETIVNKETKVSEHADNDWLIKAQDIMLWALYFSFDLLC